MCALYWREYEKYSYIHTMYVLHCLACGLFWMIDPYPLGSAVPSNKIEGVSWNSLVIGILSIAQSDQVQAGYALIWICHKTQFRTKQSTQTLLALQRCSYRQTVQR